MNTTGTIEFVNNGIKKLGLFPDLKTKESLSRYVKTYPQYFKKLFLESDSNIFKSTKHFEITFKNKFLYNTVVPLYDYKGAYQGFILVIQDFSNRKKMEAQI